MALPVVTLGSGPGALENVTVVGYGAMNLDTGFGPSLPAEESANILKAVFASGVRHFDTAEAYRSTGFGAPTAETVWNEETVGAFLKTIDRRSVTIATKYFPMLHETPTDAATIAGAVDDSLRRLGTDYIDIYYLHRMPMGGLDALLEWMRGIKPIVESGKVRAVGLSEVPPDWLAEAHAVHPIAAVQQEWSVMTRGLESDLVPACVALGIAIVAYSPLARGLAAAQQALATEAVVGFRASIPRFQGEALEANLRAVKVLDGVAERRGCTTAQVCLAWLLAKAKQLNVTLVVIPGSRNAERAASNAGAARVVFSDGDMEELDKVAELVVGDRSSKLLNYLSYENVTDVEAAKAAHAALTPEKIATYTRQMTGGGSK